jgi:hypothetical protein
MSSDNSLFFIPNAGVPAETSFEDGRCPQCRTLVVEIVPRGYLHISFLQPLRERQRSKGISRSKTLVVIV